MNITRSVSRFFDKHIVSDDYIGPEMKPIALSAGSAAVGAAVGYQLGKVHATRNFSPGETVDVDRTYFVKTGTETYMGTCHGRTSSGETMTFQCAQTRDTGYNITRTEQVDAVDHFAMRGLGIGAAVGLVGGIAASLAVRAVNDY